MRKLIILLLLASAPCFGAFTNIVGGVDTLGTWLDKINNGFNGAGGVYSGIATNFVYITDNSNRLNTAESDIDILESQTNLIQGAVQTNELVYNAMDYGATGDGATDDTTTLQSAIDAAMLAGAKLYIPAGTYKITASLVVTPPDAGSIYIYGAGEGFGNGTTGATVIVQYTSGQDGIRITSGENVSGCVIEDLNIYHNTYANRTGSGLEVTYDSGQHSRITFRNVNIQRFQKAFDLQFIDQSAMINCYATQCSYGIYMDPNYVINGFHVIGGAMTACDTASVYVGYGRGVVLSGMDLGNGPSDAIVSIAGQSMGINVIGCSFEPNTADAVCIRIDSEETSDAYFSTVNADGNAFGGSSFITTNSPIVIESKNVILSATGNQHYRYPAGTPMVRIASGAEGAVVIGNPFWNVAESPSKHGGIGYAGGEFVQMSGAAHIPQSSDRSDGYTERGALVWYDANLSGTNTYDAMDDLQTVYRDANSGESAFKRSSLLNDKIVDPLRTWALMNPASSMTDAAHLGVVFATLQDAINEMEPYGWATNWVEIPVSMVNGTTYPVDIATEVANGSFHLQATNSTSGSIALYKRGETPPTASESGELFGSAVGGDNGTYKVVYRVWGTDDATYPFRLRTVATVNGNSATGALALDTIWNDQTNGNTDSMTDDWNEHIFTVGGAGNDQYLQFGTRSDLAVTYDVIFDIRLYRAEVVSTIPSAYPTNGLSTVTFTNGMQISCTSTSLIFSTAP